MPVEEKEAVMKMVITGRHIEGLLGNGEETGIFPIQIRSSTKCSKHKNDTTCSINKLALFCSLKHGLQRREVAGQSCLGWR